jgi:hypothetical protein
VLYRWRDVYRKEGSAGLWLTGQSAGVPNPRRLAGNAEAASARRIVELERKIGQQALGRQKNTVLIRNRRRGS